MPIYDHEEDDAQLGWEQDYRLNCAFCGDGTRMPGSPLCRYCDWRAIPTAVHNGILQLEHLLLKNVPWSEYQAMHGLI